MPRPDAGTYNERTTLAWQRTALALVGGSAVLTRITLGRLGVLSLLSLAVGGSLGVWVFLEGRGRYRRGSVVAPADGVRGGRATAALAIATLAIGLTALLALIVG